MKVVYHKKASEYLNESIDFLYYKQLIMKTLFFLLIAIIGVALLSCGQKNPGIATISGQEQSQGQIEESSGNSNSEISGSKFLIIGNSVGYFTIGESWQNFAKNDYNYESVQGYGTCTDACCDGGFDLGSGIIETDYGQGLKNIDLTIGAVSFDQSKSDSKNKNNPDVFYISSDNCSGWYWKDTINYIVVYSDLFKTKEGIGVGTTLEEVQEKFGKIQFHIGWIEENGNAIQIKIKSYPGIEFILDVDDYAGNWEDISNTEDKNTITISDFKKSTKIKRIIIGMHETSALL